MKVGNVVLIWKGVEIAIDVVLNERHATEAKRERRKKKNDDEQRDAIPKVNHFIH